MLFSNYLSSVCLSFFIYKVGMNNTIKLPDRCESLEVIYTKDIKHFITYSKCLNMTYYFLLNSSECAVGMCT